MRDASKKDIFIWATKFSWGWLNNLVALVKIWELGYFNKIDGRHNGTTPNKSSHHTNPLVTSKLYGSVCHSRDNLRFSLGCTMGNKRALVMKEWMKKWTLFHSIFGLSAIFCQHSSRFHVVRSLCICFDHPISYSFMMNRASRAQWSGGLLSNLWKYD